MLTLYVRTGCPYCAKVFEAAEPLGITFEQRNIDDPAIEQELEERGGKVQTPYLIDSDTGEEMYESDKVIEYLHQHFGKNG